MGIGRIVLTFYVGVIISAIAISFALTALEGKAVHILGRSDWWMFIVSCGVLAICDALEEPE